MPIEDRAGDGPPISVTPKAVAMAKKKLESAPAGTVGLRVGVRGGGCSGFSYAFDFADKVRDGKDQSYLFDGLRVVVDVRSLDLLAGAVLDWEDKLMGYGFRWRNPNVESACGCGDSFTPRERKGTA